MRRLSLWIVGAAAFALAAAASVPVQADTSKDTLVIAKQIADIITLDPAEVFEFSGGEVIANVYDRIFTFEAEDTQTLVPGVAEGHSPAWPLLQSFTARGGGSLPSIANRACLDGFVNRKVVELR